MSKNLKDMSLTELWELFPIVLVPHKHEWSDWAKEETALLSRILVDFEPQLNHIGSTAIPDIHAKPIIDILVEISPDTDWKRAKAEMETAGYICMSSSQNRMSFNKGYTPKGYAEKVFHIHFHAFGDNDEILFRDFLRSHPEVAREYEALKRSLLPRYRNDRDGYTDAKSEFVKSIINKARKQSRKRLF